MNRNFGRKQDQARILSRCNQEYIQGNIPLKHVSPDEHEPQLWPQTGSGPHTLPRQFGVHTAWHSGGNEPEQPLEPSQIFLLYSTVPIYIPGSTAKHISF